MILKKIWSLITRQKLVCLQDIDGELTYTFAYETPFGTMAKRHWPFNIRNVYLNADGTVNLGLYVKQWKEVK